jgi:hypothetical protein
MSSPVMRLVAVALAVTLVACGGRGWPEDVERNFVDSCRYSARKATATPTDAAIEKYCRCALERMERRYTADEFQRLEDRLRTDQALAAEQAAVVADCIPLIVKP